MIRTVLSSLSPAQKSRIRGWYRKSQQQLVRRFLSYDATALTECLRKMGIRPGDTLMVHSAFGPLLGFRGSPNALIDVLLDAVGEEGNLLMVSMSYSGSSAEYLRTLPYFDVQKTISLMGLVSETFRRRPAVVRSLNSTHPVLAFGPKAEWIVSGHENCPYPCGPGSPFEKLLKLNGKVLFYGASVRTFTFYHYLEHLVKEELPFPLYEGQPFEAQVIDHRGQIRIVTTYVFSQEAIPRRRPDKLFAELMKRKQWNKARLGNTPIVLIDVSHALSSTLDLAKRGIYFFEMSRISGA